MTQVNDRFAIERAKRIARRTLESDYDPLLACRELASLRLRLPLVADKLMDTFVCVASEVDHLPLGAEREHWSAEALRSKDVESDDYRKRVQRKVREALQEILSTLGGEQE